MHNVIAIFKKQLKDTLKNKTVLIQFVMFPVLTLVMSHTIKIDGMPENFFVNLFATMYIGMAPLTSIAAIVSEEKEQNTLRVLLMSNVKPWEYLLGAGSYIWLACMLGSLVICAAGSFSLQEGIIFMIIMAAGISVSLLIGLAIGTWSRTQMMATSISIPVMMIFSFLPMLSMFHTGIAKIARFTYSEQISIMLKQVSSPQPEAGSVGILTANIFLFAVLFSFAYKRCGLDSRGQ